LGAEIARVLLMKCLFKPISETVRIFLVL
ncbi:putative hydrolase domain protein, partial [Chlamydia psittaci 84-8471/1]